ncbi:MAG: hypothetical protein A2Z29_08230 [Chloroflexi bacterium RBG_16_56_11]|nr:MAG: hypothetical protein A2Z29_08230 [Chloroflexi bacterium RBG_16_56_11]
MLAGLAGSAKDSPRARVSWWGSLAGYVDIRFLMFGSLLPDIVDKPIGHFIFRDTFNNGRIFAHTLLFFLLLSAAGFFLYRRRHSVWMLTLAAGTLAHLALDAMWYIPATLFWPLMGFEFEKIDLESWLPGLLQALVSDPVVFAGEMVGLAVVLWLGLVLFRRKKIGVFIRSGKMS